MQAAAETTVGGSTLADIMGTVEGVVNRIMGAVPDVDRPLSVQGLDSLATLEMRQQLQARGVLTIACGCGKCDLTVGALAQCGGASACAACPLQAALGIELLVLVEEPEAATVRSIAEEAAKQLAGRRTLDSSAGLKERSNESAGADSPPYVHQAVVVTQSPHQAAGAPSWIAPAPVAIKMRIFCLPYAGGVSENVFGRRGTSLPALDRHRL